MGSLRSWETWKASGRSPQSGTTRVFADGTWVATELGNIAGFGETIAIGHDAINRVATEDMSGEIISRLYFSNPCDQNHSHRVLFALL